MEADNAADAPLGFGYQEIVDVVVELFDIGFEGGEVIVENEGACVVRVAHSTGARVTRAKVTVRVIGDRDGLNGLFYLPLPWTLSTVRRDEDPLTSERVQPAVRLFRKHSFLEV